MNRKFITNLALVILLNLLVKPFWIFGIEVSVQNAVGAENYGFYFSLFGFSLMLNVLLDIGITNYNNRNIAQNHQLISKYVSSLIVLKFILALVYFTIAIIAATAIGWGWHEIKFLLILLFNQFLASFALYLRSNISGLQFFRTDSIISVLDRTLMIIICGILLWGNVTDTPFQIEWFVYAQTLAYLLAALTAFFVVLSKTEFLKLNYDRTFFIAILKKSFPFALLFLLMSFYYRVDSVMIERLLPDGKEQAGIYAQGFRILEAAFNFALLFAALLLPMFSKMIKQKESIQKLLKLSYSLIIVPALAGAIACLFYSYEIMDLLYHEHVNVSSKIFSLLIIGFISISTIHIFGTLLTANGSLKHFNILAASVMIINIILNFILIPMYGAYGSAIANLVTQSLMAFALVILVSKIFKLKINYRYLFSLSIYIVSIVGLGFFATQYIQDWRIGIALIIFISMIVAFSIRLINIKALYQIIKYDKD